MSPRARETRVARDERNVVDGYPSADLEWIELNGIHVYIVYGQRLVIGIAAEREEIPLACGIQN